MDRADGGHRSALRGGELYGCPNALAPCYSRFRVAQRLLLTGHSHQAWPDRALEGPLAAFADAAAAVDEKWERAAARAARVRRGFAAWLDDRDGSIALAASTHELLVRLLSALPLAARPRLVTTDGEFHSARRQFARLEEEGIAVVRVPARPAADVGERLAAAVDDRTALAYVSTVFFATAEIAGGLPALAAACRRHGAVLVLDLYHQLGAVPFSLAAAGLPDAYALGGGYKYLQLGEGNCFLRLPPDCRLRPVVTGWFAEFSVLTADPGGGMRVAYAPGGDRFAGGTYDPTSHYRASEVMDFFAERGLGPAFLREVSQHQVGRLAGGFEDLDLDPALVGRASGVPLAQLGGFLALRSPRAGELCAALGRRGVAADSRGTILRLGPAPYLSDAQLDAALSCLGEAAREVAATPPAPGAARPGGGRLV